MAVVADNYEPAGVEYLPGWMRDRRTREVLGSALYQYAVRVGETRPLLLGETSVYKSPSGASYCVWGANNGSRIAVWDKAQAVATEGLAGQALVAEHRRALEAAKNAADLCMENVALKAQLATTLPALPLDRLAAAKALAALATLKSALGEL